jgi:hypothetical protein
MFTDRLFLVAYLRRFSKLGALNRDLLVFISKFFEWKRDDASADSEPRFFDFSSIESLRRAESTFYEVGEGVDQAIRILEQQLENLQELARFFVAHMCARVAGNSNLVTSRSHVESIDLGELEFDAAQLSTTWKALPVSGEDYEWQLDPHALAEISRSGIPA